MFSSPFGSPFRAPIAAPGVTPWYLLGGVSLANCVAAYQPKGAASLAASYVNLAHPGTNDAAPGTAPTFNTATGWTFTGTEWLETGITPTSAYGILIQFTDATVTEGGLCGADATGNARFYIIARYLSYAGNPVLCAYGNNFNTHAPGMAAGNLANVGGRLYKDGLDVAPAGGTWSGSSTNTIAVGKIKSYQNGVGKVRAVAIYSTGPTPTQVGLIAAAMAAL